MDSTSLHYAEVLQAANRMVIKSIPNRRATDGAFSLTGREGQVIWEGRLDASERTRVLSSPDGRFLCLGYMKLIEHKGKSMRERHAALHDDSGRRLWDQGSPFFQADPLLVTVRGEVLISDGKGSLFMMHGPGKLEACAKLPSPIDAFACSRDGSSALVHCADGSLSAIKIVE